jgi:hypothetical protein
MVTFLQNLVIIFCLLKLFSRRLNLSINLLEFFNLLQIFGVKIGRLKNVACVHLEKTYPLQWVWIQHFPY